MVIVSKTDKIPTKRIVSVLRTITLRGSEMWSKWDEAKAMERIMFKAKQIGANAVINFTYRKEGTHVFCTGLGAIVEDIEPILPDVGEKKELKLCENCGSQLQKEYKFCPFCGAE